MTLVKRRRPAACEGYKTCPGQVAWGLAQRGEWRGFWVCSKCGRPSPLYLAGIRRGSVTRQC